MYMVIFSALMLFSFAAAHEEDSITENSSNDFTVTEKLIQSGVSCDRLTDEQLEKMGEYYMEQMHPGEAHEQMHTMMGFKEGSGVEEQFHITMAKTIYCAQDSRSKAMMDGKMMGDDRGGDEMMKMMGGGKMMSSGMIGNFGMMNGYFGPVSLVYYLLVALLVALLMLIVLWIVKIWRELRTVGGHHHD